MPREAASFDGARRFDRADEIGAIRVPNGLEHADSAFLSELPAQNARQRLLLRAAALQGRVCDRLGGTIAAQVGFGRRRRASNPLITQALDHCRKVKRVRRIGQGGGRSEQGDG